VQVDGREGSVTLQGSFQQLRRHPLTYVASRVQVTLMRLTVHHGQRKTPELLRRQTRRSM
jgi:hypothetical protein